MFRKFYYYLCATELKILASFLGDEEAKKILINSWEFQNGIEFLFLLRNLLLLFLP
jgi:hypothetical protein